MDARKRRLKRPAFRSAELRRFFDLVIANDKTVTVYSQGVNQSSAGADKVNAIINTHLLTGRIGKPGCGPFSVTGQPNAMGGREVGGLANMLAAHMEIDNADHRALTQDFWRSPAIACKAGAQGGRACSRPSTTGASRRCGSSPPIRWTSMPDADFVRAALEKCPFVVVSDVVEKHRHRALRPCAAARRSVGRKGRHGHQFRAAHLTPARLAQGAGRGARRLAGDLRRGATHGFRRSFSLRWSLRRSSANTRRCPASEFRRARLRHIRFRRAFAMRITEDSRHSSGRARRARRPATNRAVSSRRANSSRRRARQFRRDAVSRPRQLPPTPRIRSSSIPVASATNGTP